MAAEAKEVRFEGGFVRNFLFYLEHSKEQEATVQALGRILPGEFKRIGAGKGSLGVLGVGSGGGHLDVPMLELLQNTFPDVPLAADIIDVSTELTDHFRALLAKTSNLQKVPFVWHMMRSEEFQEKVKASGDAKRFDFIHMIQMMYYVEDLTATIQFFHGLLRDHGRLMIIIESENSGWDSLWRRHKEELCTNNMTTHRSSREVKACLKNLGLKYEEHLITSSFDITECFDPSSPTGKRLLSFMTDRDDFYQSFTPQTRADILDVIRTKCSTEKDGRIFFFNDHSCIFVHA